MHLLHFPYAFQLYLYIFFFYFNYLFSFRSVVVSISRWHWKIAEELIFCTFSESKVFNNSYYDNDNTLGKLVGNAQRNARPKDNDCSQWQQTMWEQREREKERECQKPREFRFQREGERERAVACERARRQFQQRRQLRCEWASKAEFKTLHTHTHTVTRRGG